MMLFKPFAKCKMWSRHLFKIGKQAFHLVTLKQVSQWYQALALLSVNVSLLKMEGGVLCDPVTIAEIGRMVCLGS